MHNDDIEYPTGYDTTEYACANPDQVVSHESVNQVVPRATVNQVVPHETVNQVVPHATDNHVVPYATVNQDAPYATVNQVVPNPTVNQYVTRQNELPDNIVSKIQNLTKKSVSPIKMYNFNTTWCGWSKKFQPVWDNFARKVKSDNTNNHVEVIDVKCDNKDDPKIKKLCEEYNIKGYPTVVISANGKSTHYNGERTVEALMKALENVKSQSSDSKIKETFAVANLIGSDIGSVIGGITRGDIRDITGGDIGDITGGDIRDITGGDIGSVKFKSASEIKEPFGIGDL